MLRLTINEIKLYKYYVDVFDLADDGAYMHPTSYEKIKNTPILSTPPIEPGMDTMEALMRGIIKIIEEWVEWTNVIKKRTGATSSIDGVSRRASQLAAAMTTMNTTTIYVEPSQSIGQGGDQPPENNVSLTPTRGSGPLPNIGKMGEKEDDKDKGKEQEKSVAKPSSPIQVINLDGDTNPMGGQE